MKIMAVTERPPLLIQQLVEIWNTSVKSTHLFLSDSEIESIRKYVPQALQEIPHLIVLETKSPVAFMGIDGQKLEMLFVSGAERGKGLGKKLIQYGMETYSIHELAVNEQNPLARGFYERMGFQVYRRTDHDEQGNPYPLLYMKRSTTGRPAEKDQPGGSNGTAGRNGIPAQICREMAE